MNKLLLDKFGIEKILQNLKFKKIHEDSSEIIYKLNDVEYYPYQITACIESEFRCGYCVFKIAESLLNSQEMVAIELRTMGERGEPCVKKEIEKMITRAAYNSGRSRFRFLWW